MLNYLKKFAVEIVPSVAATVIGAYIVNHYINAKPASEPPKAAVMSTAQPKADAGKPDAGKAEAKANPAAETAGIPASGVKAKGISEKALLEKNAAAEKAVVVEKPQEKSPEKSQERAADKPVETTASLPTESRRPASPRVAKSAPPVPSVIAAAPADAASAVEDRRDANDLARAAIERLRSDGEAPQRAQPALRAPEVAHVPEEPRVIMAAPPSTMRPLPPPIVVATPSEAADPAALRADPSRPTPPAEIPLSRPPLDLRAEAVADQPKQKTNVAEDVLSAAKSMFHAVLPK
ncbi:hypothetical protein [Bradyrhizobium sp.]|uniref:hypothetical protein n=1 Tax=Bradyrhizobium sp. TaxID=376 RepID=UPI001E02B4F0|nr:hypothetical protein [Bradyrhizobium sp.]MBI5320930.1 hypothetical protein [Bradyrhizobium sp.]